jgi:solute carrier family 25 folate transporter 32
LYFFFYEKAKMRYRVMEGHDLSTSSTLTPGHHMAAAIQASAVTVSFTNPLWLVKTRLQLQLQHHSGNPGAYTGMVHALRSIVATDGLVGLYRGFGPALLLTSHGAVQFAAYEKMKQLCAAHAIVTVGTTERCVVLSRQPAVALPAWIACVDSLRV